MAEAGRRLRGGPTATAPSAPGRYATTLAAGVAEGVEARGFHFATSCYAARWYLHWQGRGFARKIRREAEAEAEVLYGMVRSRAMALDIYLGNHLHFRAILCIFSIDLYFVMLSLNQGYFVLENLIGRASQGKKRQCQWSLQMLGQMEYME